jgi:hypothetical protein
VPTLGEVDCDVIESEENIKKCGSRTRVVTKRWFSPGIGIVKTTNEVFSNGKESDGHERSLKEYHIEQ